MNEWNKPLYTPFTDCGKGLNSAERNLSWIPIDLKRQTMNDSYIQHLRNISITESTMFYLTVEKIKKRKREVQGEDTSFSPFMVRLRRKWTGV